MSKRKRHSKRVRLTQSDREELGRRVESAASKGYEELRVFWVNGKVKTTPIRMGSKEGI